MSEARERLYDILRPLSGLFVGQLDPHEIEALNEAEAIGLAYRDFNHSAGLLGLAKVRIIAGASA